MHFRKEFLVAPGDGVSLAKLDPGRTPGGFDKPGAVAQLKENIVQLAEAQNRLYASKSYAVLIVLQALDAGGKDGTIRKVFSGVNPQGVCVTSFKVPSAEEAEHDYLWRIHRDMPPRGMIGIFNRSHYEDIIAVRVRELVPEAVWSHRYEQINAFEHYLAANDVVIMKFFLHISREEQRERFFKRLDNPRKRWKYNPDDHHVQEDWDDYMQAYDDVLTRCSRPRAPWYVIPADHKWYRNLAVSGIVLETLADLKLQYPR